jgi:hypothetical protein
VKETIIIAYRCLYVCLCVSACVCQRAHNIICLCMHILCLFVCVCFSSDAVSAGTSGSVVRGAGRTFAVRV